MSQIAISVQNVSKRYRIGQREPYQTLRDVVAETVAAPFRALTTSSRAEKTNRGWFWALKDVSFDVHEGEVVGIVGANGAGKSTLLKVLSNITHPTTGRAAIYGRVGSLLEVGTGFNPELTGRENTYLNGAILGMKKSEITRRFDEIVDFAEVATFIDTPVKRYSSGMRMRLAFAVAAHLEPEILLVDEVLAVGDTAFQRKCLGKMGTVAKEGRTVLFVSHNMEAVEQLCSRAVLLAEGQVKLISDVETVVNAYLSSIKWRSGSDQGVLTRNADGSLELVTLELRDEQARLLSVAQSGRDLTLRLQFRATVDLPRATVSVGVNNLYGTRIAVLHSAIAGYEMSLPAGTYTVACRIPALALAAGSYDLDIKVDAGAEIALWAPHIAQLTVEAGDFYRTGKLPEPAWAGYCYLPQRWEIDTCSTSLSSDSFDTV